MAEDTEVRIRLPMKYAAALDTLANHDQSNRTALCAVAIKEYLDHRVYHARVLVRMFDGNPIEPDSE